MPKRTHADREVDALLNARSKARLLTESLTAFINAISIPPRDYGEIKHAFNELIRTGVGGDETGEQIVQLLMRAYGNKRVR